MTFVKYGVGLLLLIAVLAFSAFASSGSSDETQTYRTTVLQTNSAALCLPKSSRVRDLHDPQSNATVRWVRVVSVAQDDDATRCSGLAHAAPGMTGAVLVDDLDR